ncbi:hypothetical protein NSR98_25585, partial [Salmonella enterica]|nr:hypothetical protein [Salmonella enterica]
SLAFAAPFSMLDTAFGLADSSMTDQVQWFGLAMPLWLSLALGDFGIKVLMSVVMLVPYGAILALQNRLSGKRYRTSISKKP